MGYLRLIRSHGSKQDGQMEQAGLEALLATIPGVSAVALHGRHPKGGYRIGCTIEKNSFDSVISTLEDNGWMSAI